MLGLSLALSLGSGSRVAPPSVADQSIVFGRDTRIGHGAIVPTNTGGPISSASITSGNGSGHWQISSAGALSPAVNGGLSASYTLGISLNGGLDTASITITTEANTYSIATAADMVAVNAIAVATVSGKTIKMRAGDYIWPDGINAGFFRIKAYTSEVIVTSHDNANRGRFLIGRRVSGAAQNCELRSPTHLTFYQVDFYAPWDASVLIPGVDDQQGALLVIGTDYVKFQDCDISSNLLELYETRGNIDGTYRGIIATTAVTGGGIEILDCHFHGSWRVLQVLTSGGFTAPVRVLRNTVTDFGVDAIIISGSMPDIQVNDNIIWKPLTYLYPTFSATVNVAANTFTTSTPHGWTVGLAVTINFLVGSTSLPGGVTAGFDYHGTVVDASTIHMTDVTMTTTGSGVLVTREPGHGDFLQGLPGVGSVFKGEIRRNIMLAARDDAIPFVDDPQGIFIEDLNTSGNPDTTHPNLIVEGNMLYSRVANGLYVANAYNTWAFNNTLVAPADAVVGVVPTVSIANQFNGSRAGNVLLNNLARLTSTVAPSAGGSVTNNLNVLPDAIAGGGTKYSDIYFNPGTPTSPADFLTRFAIKAGSAAFTASPKIGAAGTGYDDYSAHTSASPSEPASITGPVLTSVGGTPTGATTATLAGTTDQGDGTFYWIVSTLSTRPIPSQVLAGQSSSGAAAAFSSTSAVVGTGAQAKNATGLTTATTYYLHAMHVSAAGNYSVVTTSASFVTS